MDPVPMILSGAVGAASVVVPLAVAALVRRRRRGLPVPEATPVEVASAPTPNLLEPESLANLIKQAVSDHLEHERDHPVKFARHQRAMACVQRSEHLLHLAGRPRPDNLRQLVEEHLKGTGHA